MDKLLKAVEKNRELILKAERYIWQNPETGYKEFKTTKYMEDIFEELGYTLTKAEGITGFYTVLDTGKPGPEVLVLGELDSIICPEHKDADPQTGAVHSCGHNAQCAALIGIAAALKEEGALDGMCGKIKLCAVPAEELLEIEYRAELKKKGIIKYMGGKGEFLYRGYFDDSDIAMMIHTSVVGLGVRPGSVGCLAKKVTYKGKAAHAGGAPWNGVNALYAATCGLNAINAIRETFKEPDIIRVHPIMTKGGSMVNAIPAEAKIESYVRGSSFEAIIEANKKVNRALCGAAVSLGANIDIEDIPGYAPLINCPELIDLYCDACEIALPGEEYTRYENMSSGSTDMGDLSCVMPVIHPYAGGSKGTSHGSDYEIVDPEKACVESAKIQLCMLKLLLENDAKRAKSVIENNVPMFTKEEYIEYMDSLYTSGDRIDYSEEGVAKVTL